MVRLHMGFLILLSTTEVWLEVGRRICRCYLKITRMETVNSRQLWGRNVIYTKDVLAKRWHCSCIDFAVDEQAAGRLGGSQYVYFNSRFSYLVNGIGNWLIISQSLA